MKVTDEHRGGQIPFCVRRFVRFIVSVHTHCNMGSSASAGKYADSSPATATAASAGDGRVVGSHITFEKPTNRTLAQLAKQRVDWSALEDRLPIDRTLADYQQRMDIFSRFDANQSGRLSVEEVVFGIHDLLELDQAAFNVRPFVEHAMKTISSVRKLVATQQASLGGSRDDAVMASYQSLSDGGFSLSLAPTDGSDAIVTGVAGRGGLLSGERNDVSVDRTTFRLVLLHLRDYCRLWHHFCLFDTNRDYRITKEEFNAAVPRLRDMGWITGPCINQLLFTQMDRDGSGNIVFEEFADWALGRQVLAHLDEGEDDPPVASSPLSLVRGGGCRMSSSIRPVGGFLTWTELRRRFPFDHTSSSLTARRELWKSMSALQLKGGADLSLFTLQSHMPRLLNIREAPVDAKLIVALAYDGLTAVQSMAASTSRLNIASETGRVRAQQLPLEEAQLQRFLHLCHRVAELLEAAVELNVSKGHKATKEQWDQGLEVLRVSGVAGNAAGGEGASALVFAVVDSNSDGFIDFDEYCGIILQDLAASPLTNANSNR